MLDFTATANEATQALVTHLAPLAIVLFGSAATGRTGPNSDLDILIIAKRDARSRKDLLHLARKAIWDVEVPIDLLLYFADEVAERRDVKGNIVYEALRTGRVVHGSV